MSELKLLLEFLPCETPDAWIESAIVNQDVLLIDHANCELKAAQSAQALIWKYGAVRSSNSDKKVAAAALNLSHRHIDRHDLLNKMSKLAREELRHFEQVIAIMKARNVEYRQINSARYAGRLHKAVRSYEPARLVDTLIIGAFIEARSCERFAKLAPFLDEELAEFYRSLLKSESRHFRDYLKLAGQYSDEPIDERLEFFAELEQELIESADAEFRFHSGPLVA